MSLDDAELNGHLFGPGQPCFGCAPEHPFGFKLTFERIESGVSSRFVPEPRYQGPPGIMHGGLVMTLADEIGAWALLAELGKFGFTAEMQAQLRAPVRIGVEVEGRARILRSVRRIANVSVELDQAGLRVFEATLKFALLDRSGAEGLLGGPLPERWQRFAR